MDCLRVGTRFPELRVPLLGGGSLELPDALHDATAVLLFYRGHW